MKKLIAYMVTWTTYGSWLQGAKKLKDDILAITVCSNHVHIVFKSSAESIQNIVRRYKYASTTALRKCGLQGRIWSKGFDKRYCYTNEEVENKIKYVQSHN